jgi:alpha-tubulin suppressor-like RCC1 family protein
LTNDGHVYSWGNNDEGQCGRPFWNSSNNYEKDFTNIQTPYQLEDLKEPIIAVACGVSHSLLLSLNGNVYFFGTYKNGNAKDFRPWAKDKQDRVYPIEREEFSHREKARVKALEASIRQQKRDIENGHIQVMDAFLIENDPDDTIQCVSPPKGKQFYPIRLEVPGKAVKIACGHCFSAAILEDGSCVTWGVLEGTDGPIDVNLQPLKWYDELALAKSNMKRSVITIACGDYHLLLVASDPLSSGDWNVFSSGRNNYGQLGLGYVSTDVTTLIREPTKVSSFLDAGSSMN